MSRIEKTAFISYRRSGGSAWALAVSQNLTHHGFDVFFDYEGIASGDFQQVILDNIRARAHFLVLLTPSALERIDQRDDWLRREIETALKHRRIYGPWGDGKTSIVNMMAEALAPDESVICVPFNPWHFEDESHLIRAFFDTLADAIGKRLTTKKEELGKFLQRYGGILSLASFSVAGGLAEVNPGAAAAGLGDPLSSVGLDDLKERVSKVLVESGKRVVVLIDDIDRLDRAEIHAILKLIKRSASFSNTAYVLAFDDDVVAASLGERYGAGGIDAGRQFLE